MEKYIVKIDVGTVTTNYYEVEAESEEEALRTAANGGEKAKFLFDEVNDGGKGIPEIERRPIELVKRQADESKCCLDCSTGLCQGLDCDTPRIDIDAEAKHLEQLKKRYKELYYKDRGEIAVDGAFWHHDDNEAKVDYRKLLPEEHDEYEHEMKMLAFEMLDVQNAIARQNEIDRYDYLLSWKAKEYAKKQKIKKRIDELSEEHA